MEGIIILSNNKPLLSSHFVRPLISQLAIDAFLSQQTRARASRPNRSTSHGKARASASSVDPVIYFEAFPDAGKTASPGGGLANGSGRGKRRARQNSYSVTSDEEDDGDEDEESDQADTTTALNDAAAAWAGQDQAATSSSSNAHSKTSEYACCHISHNNLFFLVPMRRDADPAVAFSYMGSLLGVLKLYLNGEVSDISLRENFDIVLQILAETLSAPYPVSTDASALSELVPSTTFLDKLLSAGLTVAASVPGAAGAGVGAGSASPGYIGGTAAPFSSPLHWRRAGIRHPQNEVYFDVHEEIKAVLDNSGNIITGDVWGRIDCRSRLSGMPDLSMTFSNPSMLDDISFHPCVRLGKWTSTKSLSFVPPDGEFELMGYRLNPSFSSLSSSMGNKAHRTALSSTGSSASGGNIPIPIRVRPIVTLGEVGGSFNISVAPPTSFSAGGVANPEDIVVSLYLGDNVTGLKGSISSSLSSGQSRLAGTVSITGEKMSPGGTWDFDTISHTLNWRIPKLLPLAASTLSGTWQWAEDSRKSHATARPEAFVEVDFKAPLSNISGLAVTNLRMEGERYSLYKALRSHLKGHLEIRW